MELLKEESFVVNKVVVFNCPSCTDVFPSRFKLSLHRKRKHEVKQEENCNTLFDINNYSSPFQHNFYRSSNNVNSNYRPNDISTEEVVTNSPHALLKAVENSRQILEAAENEGLAFYNNLFSCQKCKRTFMNRSLLKEHYQNNHFVYYMERFNSETDVSEAAVETIVSKDVDGQETSVLEDQKHLVTQLGCSYIAEIKHDSPTKPSANMSGVDTPEPGESHELKIMSNECETYFYNTSKLEDRLEIHGNKNETFVCVYCEKEFKKQWHLLRHTRTHGISPYTCTVCYKTFSEKLNLKRHIITDHDGDMKPEIELQVENITSSIVKKPLTQLFVKNGGKFTCEYCNKSFLKNWHLLRHTRLHGIKPYKCNKCNIAFSGKINLKKHMQIKHRTQIGEKQESVYGKKANTDTKPYINYDFKTNEKTLIFDEPRIESATYKQEPLQEDDAESEVEIIYSALEFNKSPRTNSYTKEDMLTIKITSPSPSTSGVGSESDLEMEIISPPMKGNLDFVNPFRCFDCGERFPTFMTYDAHRRIHNEGMNINGEESNSTVAKKMKLNPQQDDMSHKSIISEYEIPELENHSKGSVSQRKSAIKRANCKLLQRVRKNGTKKRAYGEFEVTGSCCVCKEKLSSNVQYQAHMKTLHPDVKPTRVQCIKCNKAYHIWNDLKYHMNSHNNVTPFKCPICTKSFMSPYLLWRHKIQHRSLK